MKKKIFLSKKVYLINDLRKYSKVGNISNNFFCKLRIFFAFLKNN